MKKNILYFIVLFMSNVIYAMKEDNSKFQFSSKDMKLYQLPKIVALDTFISNPNPNKAKMIPQLKIRQELFNNSANSLLTSEPIFFSKNIIPRSITFHEPSNQCAIIDKTNHISIFDVTTGKKLKTSFIIPESNPKLKSCYFSNPIIKFDFSGQLFIKDGDTKIVETTSSQHISFKNIEVQKEEYELSVNRIEYYSNLSNSPKEFISARLCESNNNKPIAVFEVQHFIPELVLNNEYIFLKGKEKGYLIDIQNIIKKYCNNFHDPIKISDVLSTFLKMKFNSFHKTKFSPSGNHILKISHNNDAKLIVVNKNSLQEFTPIDYKPIINELKGVSPVSTFSETGKFVCIVSLNPTKPPCIIQLHN